MDNDKLEWKDNTGCQYGRATTLMALAEYLRDAYIVIFPDEELASAMSRQAKQDRNQFVFILKICCRYSFQSCARPPWQITKLILFSNKKYVEKSKI